MNGLRRFSRLLALAGVLVAWCSSAFGASLPDLQVTMTDRPDPVAPLQNITYSLTVKNRGTAGALRVRVLDKLPVGTKFVSAKSKYGTCAKVSATTVACTFPRISAGASVRATIVVKLVGACKPLLNVATVDPARTIRESNENNNVGRARTVCVDPCAIGCGAVERCDAAHLGLDDDCDGLVDEVCPCTPGQAEACLRGDPSYRDASGCYAGTQLCSADGTWGTCTGGVHPVDSCFLSDPSLCRAITALPFAAVNLKDGTGNFSADAVPDTESWSVACPDGVLPCPVVGGTAPPDDFKPLQSGEYTVTYAKGLTGGGSASCTYPLIVGGPGLRTELQWEHDLGGNGVDLDLHLHQPGNTLPWSLSGAPQDCMWANCTVVHFSPPWDSNAPDWFTGVTPPDPVDWYKDPDLQQNTCYQSPRGVGDMWEALDLGCHNPRLDTDNISCDPSQADGEAGDFCYPENTNIDYPPLAQWTRLGVHYYSSAGQSYAVQPRVKVFCDGVLSADLGPAGWFVPAAPVAFEAAGGAGSVSENVFWLVGDVAFTETCQRRRCTVVPLYGDAPTRTPFVTTGGAAEASFGPAYPAP
jgi:uncharacterized repeat protein (TIGR01451 family)